MPSVLQVLSDVSKALDAIPDKAARAGRAMTSMASQAETSAGRAEKAADRSIEASKTAQTEATALDDLLQAAVASGGAFADELVLQIQKVMAGGSTLRDFMQEFGDWVITTETGTERIRDALDGIDERHYADKWQRIAADLRSAVVSIDDAVAELAKTGDKAGQKLQTMLNLWREGRLTAERFREILEAFIRESAGTDAEALGQAIRDAFLDEIQAGRRNGTLP